MQDVQPHDLAPKPDPYKINGLIFDANTNPSVGQVRWDTTRSLWNGTMLLSALVLGPLYFSWSALVAFFVLCFVTLCCGHSVGFHRRLIHRSYQCPKWLERIMIYLGNAVGKGGPFWTIRTHDMRDWAQRSPDCHPFFSHKTWLLKDAFWYLHCRMELQNPPKFDPGPEFGNDRFYRFLNATTYLQQLPIALVLYALGGFSWVVWGVFVRVAACTTMHWYISRLAHTRGPRSWMVDGVGLMGYDVPFWSIPTMGESWHNNHHAFPASARHGIFPGQIDIGFEYLRLLEKLGLAWEIKTPENLPMRKGLRSLVAPQQNVGGMANNHS